MVESYRGVVLVTVDSLRADHVGYHGYERDTTPFMDRLAKTNLTFENAVSAGPSTSTSFPCLLSSSYLSRYPYGRGRKERLHKDRRIISEILPGNIKSGAFHSNPFISRYYGYDRGFDKFEDFFITDSTIEAGLIGKIKRWAEILLGKPPFTPGEEMNERALNWIEHIDERFFLWLHYMEPHMPYLPPRGYLDKMGADKVNHLKKILLGRRLDDEQGKNLDDDDVETLIDLYDACIRHMDDIIKGLIDRLPNDVAFMITADHGEGFGEHGYLAHQGYLYEEGIHVPLILSAGSGQCDIPVGHIDIAPTVLRLLGLDIPEGYQGEDLLELSSREGIFSEVPSVEGWITAYRGRDIKYIMDDRRGREEFYDLKNDPKEQRNKAGDMDTSRYKRLVLEHREEQRMLRSVKEKDMIAEKVKHISI